MKYKFLTLFLVPLFSWGQSFSSHTIVLTPGINDAAKFDEFAYRQFLIKRYGDKFDSAIRLEEFTEGLVQDRRSLHASNLLYGNWPNATRYVRAVLKAAIPESARDTNVKVHLVRDPSLNAGMYPDGSMHLNAGLLARVRSEAELLAILSHEYGHYVMEHGYHAYNKSVDAYNRNRKAAKFNVYGAIYMLANTGVLFKNMQSQEAEADQHAVRVFKKTGLSPLAFEAAYTRLLNEQQKEKSRRSYHRPLIYFRTHPSSEQRIKNTSDEFVTNHGGAGIIAIYDSSSFQVLHDRAIDECIYLLFEQKNYQECLEVAFRCHLFYPKDEFYVFFITESLRRDIALLPDYGNQIFITGQYILWDLSYQPKPPRFINTTRKNYASDLFQQHYSYHLQGPIFSFNHEDFERVKAKQLLKSDTLEFLTNSDALNYFSAQLNPACGAHRFSLRCMGQPTDSIVTPELVNDLERRYTQLYPEDQRKRESGYDKLLVFSGRLHIRSMKGKDDELGYQLYEDFMQDYQKYLGATYLHNEKLSFRPELAFDDNAIARGALEKVRTLAYKNDQAVISGDLHKLDPELWHVALKYKADKFVVIDFDVMTDRYGDLGTKPQKWECVMYMIDFTGNKIVRRVFKKYGSKRDTQEQLFASVAEEIKAFKDGKIMARFPTW